MKKLSISIHAFESILESLVKLEEERDLILEYYVDPNDRARISQLIEKYIETIDLFLGIVEREDTWDKKLPLVTLDCEVEVEDILTQVRQKLRLVNATDEIKHGDVSIFSAPGNALLLKKTGSIVELELPAGKKIQDYRDQCHYLNYGEQCAAVLFTNHY